MRALAYKEYAKSKKPRGRPSKASKSLAMKNYLTPLPGLAYHARSSMQKNLEAWYKKL